MNKERQKSSILHQVLHTHTQTRTHTHTHTRAHTYTHTVFIVCILDISIDTDDEICQNFGILPTIYSWSISDFQSDKDHIAGIADHIDQQLVGYNVHLESVPRYPRLSLMYHNLLQHLNAG